MCVCQSVSLHIKADDSGIHSASLTESDADHFPRSPNVTQGWSASVFILTCNCHKSVKTRVLA